jgi:hypothetical protein
MLLTSCVVPPDDQADAVSGPAIKVAFTLHIYAASERSKEIKKRKIAGGSTITMKLDSDEPYDTWMAQLLVRVEKILAPPNISIENYEISFSISRIVSTPRTMSCKDDFTDMLSYVLKTKDKTCAIHIQEIDAKTTNVSTLREASINT